MGPFGIGRLLPLVVVDLFLKELRDFGGLMGAFRADDPGRACPSSLCQCGWVVFLYIVWGGLGCSGEWGAWLREGWLRVTFLLGILYISKRECDRRGCAGVRSRDSVIGGV